jgi:hypothetical protein
MRLLLDHDCGGMNVHTAPSVRPDWDRALNARSPKPSKLTPVPHAAHLHGVSQKLASDSEGTSGSRARTRRSQRPTADGLKRPQPALRPHQPQARRRAAGVGRRQRLRILKRNHRKTARPTAKPATTLWHRHIRSVFAGSIGKREITRSEMFRQNEGPRRPRLRAWPCPPLPPSPTPAGHTPSCSRPHHRPSTHRRSC